MTKLCPSHTAETLDSQSNKLLLATAQIQHLCEQHRDNS